MGDALGLGEDGGEVVVVAGLHAGYLAGIDILLVLQVDGVVDRIERHVVEHLCALHHQILGTHLQVLVARLEFLHGHHGLAALLHGEEVDHGRCLVLVVVEGLHGHLGEEGQGALRTHHTVGHDVEGVVVGHERPQVQTRDILDFVLMVDTVGQFLVGPHPVAQVLNLLEKFGVRLAEGRLALLVAGVDDGAVGEDDAGAHHHAV